MLPTVTGRRSRLKIALFTALVVLTALMGARVYVWQLGVSSKAEDALVIALKRVEMQGASRRAVRWDSITEEKWDFVCTLPEYKNYEDAMRVSKLPNTAWGRIMWFVFWNEDDRFFGYFLGSKSGATLPVKVWGVSGWHSDQDEIVCIPFENAVLDIQGRRLSLENR